MAFDHFATIAFVRCSTPGSPTGRCSRRSHHAEVRSSRKITLQAQGNKGRIQSRALRGRSPQTVQGVQVRDCREGQEALDSSLEFGVGLLRIHIFRRDQGLRHPTGTFGPRRVPPGRHNGEACENFLYVLKNHFLESLRC